VFHSSSLVCARCHEVVLKSINGVVKLRGKVVLFKDQQAFVVCKGCNTELPVPLKLDMKVAKALSESVSPLLYLK